MARHDNQSLDNDKWSWLLKENLEKWLARTTCWMNENQKQIKRFQMERWIFACPCTFALCSLRGKHSIQWGTPWHGGHQLKPTTIISKTHYTCEQIIWLQSAPEKWVSDHLMRSQREDLKYADDEQKTLCCDRGKFLELICQFGLNLQVGLWLTTALTHLSTGNFILFILFVGWNDAQASSEANETKSVLATLTDYII